MPTAPATELEANEEHKINGINKSCSLRTYKTQKSSFQNCQRKSLTTSVGIGMGKRNSRFIFSFDLHSMEKLHLNSQFRLSTMHIIEIF